MINLQLYKSLNPLIILGLICYNGQVKNLTIKYFYKTLAIHKKNVYYYIRIQIKILIKIWIDRNTKPDNS